MILTRLADYFWKPIVFYAAKIKHNYLEITYITNCIHARARHFFMSILESNSSSERIISSYFGDYLEENNNK